MSTRRATITDVARTAGVSPSTASVVFSGKTPVSEATRARVLEAAASLGYTGPDPRAASLRRGRSGIVGVVFHGHLGGAFVDPVMRTIMDGLAEAVAPLGAGLLLLREGADQAEGASLTSAPIDAAVILGSRTDLAGELATLRARGIPVVVIGGDAGPEVPRIILDNREAQRAIASHIRSLGHSRVALVTLPPGTDDAPGWMDQAEAAHIPVDVTRDRLQGARDVFPDAPAYAGAGSRIDEGLRAGREILARHRERPTAILAQSDLLAAGVLRAADEAGLRVPEDLSVTGFDGIEVDGIAPFVLTTMWQPAADQGRAAGAAIVAMLEDDDAASVCFTSVYREGNTTAPVPTA